jgi:hypothetical protein
MRRTCERSAAAVIAAGMLLAVLATDAGAQLKGHYVPGFTGLQNGTQPSPGISIFLPVYFYTTDDIRNDDGESIGDGPRVHVTFTGPGAAWVTNAKVLGANLGGSAAPIALIKSRLEGNALDVPGSFQFTDIFLQPVQPGWHTPRADFVAGYGLFLPTGKWDLGGDDNAGLGMWSYLFQAGTTVNLDAGHTWSVSTLASYEIHSHKEDTDIKVGDILTLEGGLGRTFLKMEMVGERPVPSLITIVGLAYYGQFKVTSDEGGQLTPLLEGRKDRVYGLGPEVTMIIPQSRLVFGLRVEPEFGARNRTQGWTIMFTGAYELKSLSKEG